MTHPRQHPRHPAPRPAFTLVELMISIALVLLLILGVNQVFLYTGQAIGAGEAIGDAVRDSRSVQSVFANDFTGIAPNGATLNDSAFLTINSAATPAFLNANDLAADKDANPLTQDLNGTGNDGDPNVPGDVISPATYNSRNHRLDMLGFFTRGNFQRQTGNDGTFVANMSAPEAYVSYGHLWLPDNNGAFLNTSNPPVTYPGVGTTPANNPNNFFATQFVLGRVAMLLRHPNTAAPVNVIYDNGGTSPVSQAYASILASNGLTCPLFSTCIYKIGSSSAGASVTTSSGTTTSLTTLNQSRFDLAGSSIKTIQANLEAYLASSGATDMWWYTLMGLPANNTAGAPPARFQCNPFVPKPLTAAAMAQASPFFLRGCSQFIVEYAGDFLTQNNDITNVSAVTGYGAVLSPGGDGTLDYVLIPPPGVTPVPPRAQWRKQIIWYGLPRSTSGQGTIAKANGDVVPLRDWRETAYTTPSSMVPPQTVQAPFEKVFPTFLANYTTMAAAQSYTCVFGPNDPAPQLIRITITLVDPTGRLRDGQTYQYVFPVPPQ